MQENYSSLSEEMQENFEEWFEEPVPPDIHFPAEVDYSSRRRREDNLQILSEILKFGFGGAVSLGTIVGFSIIYLSLGGWYSNNWPDPSVVIILAVVIGFMGGLYKGLFYQLSE